MIETIIKGIGIGILISAPMGPIGVLCIQRTLNGGRLQGFVSGVGATLSDLLYAIIAGLGIGFIMDFIKTNHYPLQIIGSIVLLILGYYIYQSNPVQKLIKQNKIQTAYWQNLLSAFLINLSNIGILFLFIAMFARFNFIDPNNKTQNLIGIASIGFGAILWWFFITTLINRIRNKLNLRALQLFNKILGIIVIIISVVGLISGLWGWFI